MNHLQNERSPYLLQHANQPVDWYPWGAEAFDKAAREDKPILVSIGYSTCHWCHVMAHESFSDNGIADIMNRNFVSVKVDREERPDVDTIYITAVSAMTGSAGWPLNIFLTPDGRPFFGGTYFPPYSRAGMPGWRDVLLQVNNSWRDSARRDNIVSSAAAITERLRGFLEASGPAPEAGLPGPGALDAAAEKFSMSYDERFGGFSGAPKFPSPSIPRFLMAYASARPGQGPRDLGEKVKAMSLHTLEAMANGGIYDHLGGGFHRYSTDERWHVPHFEKMLYDNAQLVLAFLEARQISGKALFADIARDTIEYVLRDMTHPRGGFYSAEDADSSEPGNSGPRGKKEGAFYAWTADEIATHLDEPAAEIFSYHYGVRPGGNVVHDPFGEFKGKNVLYRAHSLQETAQKFARPEASILHIINTARQKLFEIRAQRPRPHKDDKVLTSWNGLMISALARAHVMLGDQKYLEAARKAAGFIQDQMYDRSTGGLYRRWHSGECKVSATAEDYAFLIQGLIDLYEADFDPEWLLWAVDANRHFIARFYDETDGGVYLTGEDHDRHLILRVKEFTDSVLPSAASVAALNMLRLSGLTGRPDLKERAEKTIRLGLSRDTGRDAVSPLMLMALMTAQKNSLRGCFHITRERRKTMDVRDFCSGMEAELTAWKARLFDVAARTDNLGTAEKEKVWAYFNDMKIIVKDMEDKIDKLRTECPSEWGPQRREIEDAHVDMRSKYQETMEYIGKAAPVSIPG